MKNQLKKWQHLCKQLMSFKYLYILKFFTYCHVTTTNFLDIEVFFFNLRNGCFKFFVHLNLRELSGLQLKSYRCLYSRRSSRELSFCLFATELHISHPGWRALINISCLSSLATDCQTLTPEKALI